MSDETPPVRRDRHAPIGRLPVVVGHDDIDEAAEAAEIDAQNAVNDEWLAWVRSQQPDGLLPYERKKKLEAEQAAEASGDSEAGP